MSRKKRIYLKDFFDLYWRIKEKETEIVAFDNLREFQAHFLRLYRTVGRVVVEENGQLEKGTRPLGPKAMKMYDKLQAFLMRRGILDTPSG